MLILLSIACAVNFLGLLYLLRLTRIEKEKIELEVAKTIHKQSEEVLSLYRWLNRVSEHVLDLRKDLNKTITLNILEDK